ncbi:MAG: hypothetical protein AAB268_11090 [Elusimicrobiota bacterium]
MNLLLVGSVAHSHAVLSGPSGNGALGGALFLAGIVMLTIAFCLPRTDRV